MEDGAAASVGGGMREGVHYEQKVRDGGGGSNTPQGEERATLNLDFLYVPGVRV